MSGHNKKSTLAFVIFVAIVGVTMSGYFFAKQKSEPEFRTRIERIMFEKKNKSPKYILTLPEKDYSDIAEKTAELPPPEPQKLETIEDFVRAAPLVAKLTEFKNHYPLKFINIDPDLAEQKDEFFLPKISSQGRKPWEVYGFQTAVAPNFYKIAIIFKNVGIDKSIFDAMNMALPSEISFSFSPYTLNQQELISNARKFGHETYVDLLLASKNVLKSDNGPLAMGLTVSPQENMNRFYKTLSTNAPIGGIVIVDGMIDDSTKNLLLNYIKELKQRGLLMIDATLSNEIDSIKEQNLPRRKVDIFINDNFSPENIQNLLLQAEKTAQEKGQVLIVATPKPIVITAIRNWIETFSPQLSYEEMKKQNITSIERPFALVSVSNLVVE